MKVKSNKSRKLRLNKLSQIQKEAGIFDYFSKWMGKKPTPDSAQQEKRLERINKMLVDVGQKPTRPEPVSSFEFYAIQEYLAKNIAQLEKDKQKLSGRNPNDRDALLRKLFNLKYKKRTLDELKDQCLYQNKCNELLKFFNKEIGSWPEEERPRGWTPREIPDEFSVPEASEVASNISETIYPPMMAGEAPRQAWPPRRQPKPASPRPTSMGHSISGVRSLTPGEAPPLPLEWESENEPAPNNPPTQDELKAAAAQIKFNPQAILNFQDMASGGDGDGERLKYPNWWDFHFQEVLNILEKEFRGTRGRGRKA